MICLSKKVSYLLEKTLVLSIICNRCKNKGQKSFKKISQLENIYI